MKYINFEAAKGTKDWYGKETIIRNKIRNTLSEIFEKYGYDRLETPPFEKREALGFKGGGEIQKEVFSLKDQGNRDLALRFDQTVPLARYIASNKEISFPFKRYVIGEVFRDGPTQPEQGRYRVFTQCDVDVLGIKEMVAEAELFALAQDAFQALGLGEVEVNINNRKLLEGILDYSNVPKGSRLKTIAAIDKIDKIGIEGLEKELKNLSLKEEGVSLSNETLKLFVDGFYEKGMNILYEEDIKSKIITELGEKSYEKFKDFYAEFKKDQKELTKSCIFDFASNYKVKQILPLEQNTIDKILSVAALNGSNEDIIGKLELIATSDIGKQGISETKQLLQYSKDMGFNFVKLNPSLARGLDYYTGTTIEVFLKNRNIVPSAILAGGRFDDMVGDFRGGNEEIPAVGFSFGLERLAMILNENQEFPKTIRQLYLIPIGQNEGSCLRVAHDLRNDGINVDMSLQKKSKVGKAIEYASKQGIPFVGFLGENELNSGKLKIKNLTTGNQEDVSLKDVKEYLKNNKNAK